MYITTDYIFFKTDALRYTHPLPICHCTSELQNEIICPINKSYLPLISKEIRNMFYIKTIITALHLTSYLQIGQAEIW